MIKDIIALYYFIDNFCKIYNEWIKNKLLPSNKIRDRECELSLSELLTIVLYFYISPCKDFKNYYLYHLPNKYAGYFKLLSYSRIIQLWPRLILPLVTLLQYIKGTETGIYFIDSTKLQICNNKRTNSNRVFGRLAKVGKSSYGWFMGFKLHIIINNKGQIMAVKITKGNKSDVCCAEALASNLQGKVFGDKGYISKHLFERLWSQGLQMITNIRSDMKNYCMNLYDKIFLRKRSLVESVFNVLKNSMNLEHTRHRSPTNFIVHILACLSAYSLKSNSKLVKLMLSLS